MADPVDGRVAEVGCCAEIIHHHRMPDDRMKIATIGQQRFRVLDFVREKPYYVGLVEWIEDRPTDQDLRSLATDVDALLRVVIQLSAKLTGQPIELPDDIPNLPTELSYWIAGNLKGAAQEQQALLETQDTALRLEREIEILTSTRNHLAARSALEDAFKS